MPEEEAEYLVYEHRGKSLSTPIIRYILHNKIQLPTEWESTVNLKERVYQYHLRHGGAPTQLINLQASIYGVLRVMVERQILETHKERGNRYFRLLPASSNIPDLITVLQQERDRLDIVIEMLNQRKAQLDKFLSEWG